MRNQRENLRFLTPFLIYKKNNFLGHISTFFYECILEFNYATIKGFA
jgi:hypothetical protein